MRRWFQFAIFAIVLALPAGAAVIKLYLKDGSYQLAREYKVDGDRLKFYSTDRGGWEEMPLELVDLQKTEAEIRERDEEVREETKANAEEDKAERDAVREIRHVPADPGGYYVNGSAVQPMKLAEVKLVNNKRRQILKAMSPIPMVSGKETLEIDAPHALLVVGSNMPEFYIRLQQDERFGIVKMTERAGHRVVERVTIIPVSNEVMEEPVLVPIYHKQGGEALYKIWPQKPLEPGEYAVVEYTEGKINIQTWDFAVKK